MTKAASFVSTNIFGLKYQPWNAFFSGSVKGQTVSKPHLSQSNSVSRLCTNLCVYFWPMISKYRHKILILFQCHVCLHIASVKYEIIESSIVLQCIILVSILRGTFGKFLAWSFISACNLQTLSWLLSFEIAIFSLCYSTNFIRMLSCQQEIYDCEYKYCVYTGKRNFSV